MVENPRRATAILGGLVVMIVLVAFVQNLKPIEQEASLSGSKMAKAWMRASIQRYQQAWLVSGEPNILMMDGFKLHMTDEGLVSPFTADGVLDCDYWLAVHYPQRKIMASELLKIRGVVKSNNYMCDYTYANGYKVVVISSGNQLKLSVENSAE
ncbi:MSHA biogenesis protein MshF [Vibrio alfacsensis]|uniref:MSHA biogenesis protein MshF n=1 Tax=Vibrio alfacsensis TaxID=1074311 RepID=UPI002ADD87FF|nr:MSHA biogenesis protein MshF [Vibrio alfacsensis]WQE75906.1 MSHA biogenesis protein MshF [Vibrio alfacsensis]